MRIKRFSTDDWWMTPKKKPSSSRRCRSHDLPINTFISSNTPPRSQTIFDTGTYAIKLVHCMFMFGI